MSGPMELHVIECPACALDISALTSQQQRAHLLLHFPHSLVAQSDFGFFELDESDDEWKSAVYVASKE